MPPAEQPTPTHEEFAGRLAECAKHMRQPDGRLLWEMASRYIASAAINESRIAELEREVAELRNQLRRGTPFNRATMAILEPKGECTSCGYSPCMCDQQ